MVNHHYLGGGWRSLRATQSLQCRVIGLKHGGLRVVDQLAVIVVRIEQLMACMLLVVKQWAMRVLVLVQSVIAEELLAMHTSGPIWGGVVCDGCLVKLVWVYSLGLHWRVLERRLLTIEWVLGWWDGITILIRHVKGVEFLSWGLVAVLTLSGIWSLHHILRYSCWLGMHICDVLLIRSHLVTIKWVFLNLLFELRVSNKVVLLGLRVEYHVLTLHVDLWMEDIHLDRIVCFIVTDIVINLLRFQHYHGLGLIWLLIWSIIMLVMRM